MLKHLAIAGVLVMSLFGGASAEPGYDIIIVAGQSNAATPGKGPFTDPYYSEPIDARIKQVGRYGEQNMQVVPVGEWVSGVKWDGLQNWRWIPGSDGKGFALSFARRYVAEGHLASDRTLLIVPAAHGGTSVFEWIGQINKRPASLLLYPDMIARALYALSLPGQNRIVSFHWAQGEADVNRVGGGNKTIEEYRAALIEFLAKVRADLPQTPVYPIIVTKFVPAWNPHPQTTAKADVERHLQTVSRNVDPLGDFAPTTGLISNYEAGYGDQAQLVHFSAQSMVELGGRKHFARWYQCVQAQEAESADCHTQPVPESARRFPKLFRTRR